ncbi:MAG: ribonuclease protein component [Actinomycetota bacterium]|nr:ribonuclease protein component [Actinomycetota bacterium]
MHLLASADPAAAPAPARAGLVVCKAVGGSVVRTRVARRLRHQLRPLMTELPAGTRVVVRAAPAAATAPSAALDADLRAAVTRLLPATSESPVARAATSSDAT